MNNENDRKREDIQEEYKNLEKYISFQPLLKNNDKSEMSKWTKLLVATGFFTMIGTAIPCGYSIGSLNSPAAHIQRWCNQSFIERYDVYLTSSNLNVLWAFLVSIFSIAGAIGALSGGLICNRFGRKIGLLSCKLLFVISGICFMICRELNSVEMLLLGRIILGFASGLTNACLPMYLNEIAPLEIRGSLSVLCSLGITVGLVGGQIFTLGSVFGSAELWHMGLSCYAVLVLLSLAFYRYLPESPKWLYVIKGDAKAAEAELVRTRNAVDKLFIPRELEAMDIEARELGQKVGILKVLQNSKLSLPLILVCSFQTVQQFCGVNTIFNYSVSIFQKAGFSSTVSEYTNLGSGVINLIVSFFTPYLMKKCKRRTLMLLSCFVCCAALTIFTIMLYFIDAVSWFAVGCVISMFILIVSFQIGICPISFFIGAELFESKPRSTAMSIGSIFKFIAAFITLMAFPSLSSAWGAFAFLPFAVSCGLTFVLTFFYLPETKDRSATDVAILVSKGFKSKVRK